jgi:hypothetical protein
MPNILGLYANTPFYYAGVIRALLTPLLATICPIVCKYLANISDYARGALSAASYASSSASPGATRYPLNAKFGFTLLAAAILSNYFLLSLKLDAETVTAPLFSFMN